MNRKVLFLIGLLLVAVCATATAQVLPEDVPAANVILFSRAMPTAGEAALLQNWEANFRAGCNSGVQFFRYTDADPNYARFHSPTLPAFLVTDRQGKVYVNSIGDELLQGHPRLFPRVKAWLCKRWGCDPQPKPVPTPDIAPVVQPPLPPVDATKPDKEDTKEHKMGMGVLLGLGILAAFVGVTAVFAARRWAEAASENN